MFPAEESTRNSGEKAPYFTLSFHARAERYRRLVMAPTKPVLRRILAVMQGNVVRPDEQGRRRSTGTDQSQTDNEGAL